LCAPRTYEARGTPSATVLATASRIEIREIT